MSRSRRAPLLALLALIWAVPAGTQPIADEATPIRRVDFAVSREAQVENDRVTAVLSITDEDTDAAELARRINEAMQWGLDRARKEDAVRPRSGGYRTHPVTQEGRIRRWRARQELMLESDDLEALTKLVGPLQERLQLSSIGFEVSPERRRAEEDRLIEAALVAYSERAARVRKALGASGYELVHLSLETGADSPQPRPFGVEMARSVQASAPALEAGTSRVAVTVHATIELLVEPSPPLQQE